MPHSPDQSFFSFRRTFALLVLTVVVPSAGLSGFGVLAIINERAAVEKRIGAAWDDRLAALGELLVESLGAASVELTGDGLRVVSSDGEELTQSAFRISNGRVLSTDVELSSLLSTTAEELQALPRSPMFFSLAGVSGARIIALMRGPDEQLHGATLAPDRIEALLETLARETPLPSPSVSLELRAQTRIIPGEGLVGKLVHEVVQARQAVTAPQALAERPLPAPLQDFRIAVFPLGEDPVALTSRRNRVIYSIVLGLFYVTLGIGVVLTARSLYREARLSRLQTDFVSLVSHELRTPLTSIRMFIEMLAMGRVRDPKETQEVLALLAQETERLSELIERVLDWARIESGRRDYHREVQPVNEVITAALTALKAQRLSVMTPEELLKSLRVEVDEDLPLIDVDREAIAGALLNLLQNAFKYTGEEKRIRLRARRVNQGVAIEVEDNGVGLSPRDRRRIFERFFRVENLLTRKTQGSGLGLSIAQRIVQAHDGDIKVESELGRGSTFTLLLPAVPAPRLVEARS